MSYCPYDQQESEAMGEAVKASVASRNKRRKKVPRYAAEVVTEIAKERRIKANCRPVPSKPLDRTTDEEVTDDER